MTSLPIDAARNAPRDPDRLVGEEARKSHPARLRSGFVERYLSGPAILDIGYKGYLEDVVPIVEGAVGVELDYPGYDGHTLPFPDLSQDAVFASHCLEHIVDFRHALRDWFRVLRIGGFMVIMVPHKYLYEKKTELPSNYNQGHHRFYTPSSLMAEVEVSLNPNSYRLRHLVDNDAHFDYTIPPDRHSGGCYEIELVIEKIAPPAWDLATPPKVDQHGTIEAASIHHEGITSSIPVGGHTVVTRAFGTHLPARPRILVLKLGHLGDFIIGLPALRKLRAAFPDACIHLIVGSWNRAAGEACGLVDEVKTYDYFPQTGGWVGIPYEPLERFRAVASGSYDIAIDLRVDDDTRGLLTSVDAGIRCGIGLRSRLPFLDVALPPEHENRPNSVLLEHGDMTLRPKQFESRMPVQRPFYHETDFRPVSGHAVFGPHIPLPMGSFRALFGIELTGWTVGLSRAKVTLDIARASEIVALRRLTRAELTTLFNKEGKGESWVELCFDNEEPNVPHEFRIHVEGRPWQARLRFFGVRLEQNGIPIAARFRRAELHVGEQLSLLVQLLIDRTTTLYDPAPPAGPGTQRVVVAPFSNSDLRDWPAESYVALIRSLIDRLDYTVTLLGSRPQAAALERMRKEVDRGEKVLNLGGETPWPEVPDLLRQADLVICNNSGIAHLAAAAGTLTLAIYSASHQPQEWGPRGAQSFAIMAVVPCSPCGHDRLKDCPNNHTCMRGLFPETVFQEAARLLEKARPPGPSRYQCSSS